MNTDRILILTGVNTKSIHSEAPLSSFSAVSFKTVKKPKLKTVSAWKQQQSCIPCHFLTANNTKLQLTFALYFLYVSETNLIKLWFYSYFLFVLKDTDFGYFTFSTGSITQGLFHDPVTLDSLTILLSHPSSTLKHLHPHSSSPKTTMVQPITKIFMCLGHLSASLRVLLFHYFVSQLFPWKEIFQTKKTEAYFIILQSTKPVKENWKQINYLELFLRKFPGR